MRSLVHVLRAQTLLWVSLGASLAAQQPALHQALDETEIRPAEVEARLSAAAAPGALPADQAKQVEALYRSTLGLAERIAQARERIARSASLRENGAAEIADERRVRPRQDPSAGLADLSSEALALRLKSARAAEVAATQSVQEREKEILALQKLEPSLPQKIAALEQEVQRAEARWAVPPATGEPAVVAAQRSLALAQLVAARAERDAAKAHLASIQIELELATARRDRARREARAAAAVLTAVQGMVASRNQSEAEQSVVTAEQRLASFATGNPVLRAAAAETLEFARQRVVVQEELPKLRTQLKSIKRISSETKKRFSALQRMIFHVGLTQTTGDLLRQQKLRLPDVRSYRLNSRARQDQVGAIRVRQLRVDDLVASEFDRFFERARSVEPEEPGPEFRLECRTVFTARAEIVASLQRDLDEQIVELGRLETEDLLLTQLAREFETFVDEKVLWVRSTSPIWAAPFRQLAEVAASVPPLPVLTAALWDSFQENLASSLAWLLLAVALAGSRRRWRRWTHGARAGAKVAPGLSIQPMLRSGAGSVLMAAPPAILLFALGSLCRGWPVASLVGQGPGRALEVLSLGVLVLLTFRRFCSPGGLVVSHFGWNPDAAARLRRFFSLALLPGLIPLVFVWGADLGGPDVRSLVGRPLFMVAWLWGAILLFRLFRPGNSILDQVKPNPDGRPSRFRVVAFVVALVVPIALLLLAGGGYYFTAMQLSRRVAGTSGLLFGLLMLDGMINRWQLVTRRRLVQRQRQDQAAARAAAESAPTAEGGGTSSSPVAEEPMDVAVVSAQARRLARTILSVVAVLALFVMWAEVMPALGGLRDVELWGIGEAAPVSAAPAIPAVGQTPAAPAVAPEPASARGSVTLANLLLSILILVLTVAAARNLPGLLKLTLLQRARPGNQYAIATLVQYGLMILGVVLAFSAIGIGWSKIQWLIAAISLGLGFGLQEVFANFVCGLIILFERPIRVGDFVTIGTVKGEVTRIRIRATTVRNLERQELIVPNKEIITGQIINWTLTDTVVRIVLEVGIAYGSDVPLAQSTLLRVAAENKFVLEEPKPKALLREFGDSALIFEVRVFIRDLDYWPRTLDSMNQAIDREFRALGIEIAFPQRDLHVRSIVEGPLSLPRQKGAEG